MDVVNKILTQEDLKTILARACGPSAKFLSSSITSFNDEVKGFMGDYFCLLITYTMDKIKQSKQISFFMKTAPLTNEKQKEYVNEGGIYIKELLLYKNILTKMMEFCDFGPKCYFIKDEDAIILEDLSAKGFSNLEKMSFLNIDRMKTLIQTLAKYNAATVIFEEKHKIIISDTFTEEIKDCCYAFHFKGHPRQQWCKNVTKCIQDLILLLGHDEAVTKRFEKFVFEELPQLFDPSKKYRNTLTHDDLWCNNYMFNEKGECLIVDFQMARYTPPALDFYLTLCLNLCTKDMKQYFNELVDIYYETFANQLEKFDLDSNALLSKSEFIKTIQIYKLAALTEASMYGTHVFIPQQLAEKIIADFDTLQEFSFYDRSKFVLNEFQTDMQFKKRMLTVLEPLIEEVKMVL